MLFNLLTNMLLQIFVRVFTYDFKFFFPLTTLYLLIYQNHFAFGKDISVLHYFRNQTSDLNHAIIFKFLKCFFFKCYKIYDPSQHTFTQLDQCRYMYNQFFKTRTKDVHTKHLKIATKKLMLKYWLYFSLLYEVPMSYQQLYVITLIKISYLQKSSLHRKGPLQFLNLHRIMSTPNFLQS